MHSAQLMAGFWLWLGLSKRALANTFCDSSPLYLQETRSHVKPSLLRCHDNEVLSFLVFHSERHSGRVVVVKLAQLARYLTSSHPGPKALTQLTGLFLEDIRCDVIVF